MKIPKDKSWMGGVEIDIIAIPLVVIVNVIANALKVASKRKRPVAIVVLFWLVKNEKTKIKNQFFL